MGEFFKGWRRKAGLVTLAMALVLMVAWMRSAIICDELMIPYRGSLHFIDSRNGRLEWTRLIPSPVRWGEYDPYKYPIAWISFPVPGELDIEDLWAGCDVEWKWELGGFEFVLEAIGESGDRNKRESWAIPYWSLVLPLTLLSAWLILVKARNEKRTRAPIDSRSHEGQ